MTEAGLAPRWFGWAKNPGNRRFALYRALGRSLTFGLTPALQQTAMYRALLAASLFLTALGAAAGEVQPEAKHVPPSPGPATPAASTASLPTRPDASLHSCWEQAADLHRVNPQVLVAIADVESNHRPVVVNKNQNGTVDIGIMQINSSWLPRLEKYGITSRHLLDPCINVHVAAWILSKNMARFGETSWRAVGAYNATQDALRLRYAKKVHERLTKRPTKGLPAGSKASVPVERPTNLQPTAYGLTPGPQR